MKIIAIIEDNQDMLKFLTDELSQIADKIVTFTNFPEFISYGYEKFDAIISDFSLPEMNFTEAFNAISGNNNIFLITGSIDAIDRYKSEPAIVETISKPCMLDDLRDSIELFLNSLEERVPVNAYVSILRNSLAIHQFSTSIPIAYL